MGKTLDLTGQKYNRLTVIKKSEELSKDGKIQWVCKCDCGSDMDVILPTGRLRSGNTKSCGCLGKERLLEMNRNKKINLENKKFGMLKVIKSIGINKYGNYLWLCECDCGNERVVTQGDLNTGKIKDCGCMKTLNRSNAKRKYNTYDLTGEYGIGYTLKGEEFYFDLEDYDKIKDYCWSIHDKYLVSRGSDKKFIRMHRIIMDVTDESIKVDHIFHKEYDNRKSQLRLCSNAENCANHVLHKNNSSGKSGISYRNDTNKWRVRIWKDLHCYNIGQYESFEDAIDARDKAEIKYFQKFRYDEENCNG